MGKFANIKSNVTPERFYRGSILKFVLLWISAFAGMTCLCGCATVQDPGYISRVDHPYDRKIYGSMEKVTSAVVYVLKNKGWSVDSEANPSLYERDDRYDNNGYQNLLIITNTTRHYRILYSTSVHLNVFIHCLDNACDVEIRYESRTPLVKQFISVRNDQVVQGILDAVEQEVER